MATGNWEQQLRSRPLRNQAARIESDTRDAVTIVVKQERPAYMKPPLTWIVPHRPERKAELDALGSEVWHLCDGRRTVEEIVDRFAASHGLTFHESRVAVTEYISSLIKRGVLAIEIPDEE
jgi:hypothetical protein